MKCKFITLALFLAFFQTAKAQEFYEKSYANLKEMLVDSTKYDFRKAVFSVENAYMDGALDTAFVNNQIHFLTSFVKKLVAQRNLTYNNTDKETVSKHAAIFSVLKDSIPYRNKKGGTSLYLPYSYNFDDALGQKDWKSMFVSKLLATGEGNCHSLPYLYKILAEELDVTAYLALIPHHMYVKTKNERDGWYNIELTSGTFPLDAWLMASGYVHLDAIKNGVYMKALNDRESIALCLIDLAQGYERKFPDHNGDFVLKCSELALLYFPNYINAQLVQIGAQREQIKHFLNNKNANFPEDIPKYRETVSLFNRIQKTITKIHALGYREMPVQMYLDWISSLTGQKL